MRIGILELSFKVRDWYKKRIINYFKRWGEVKWYCKNSTDRINADVLIFADGGFGCSRLDIFKNPRSIFNIDNFESKPRFALGFSDPTYYMNYLVMNGIPCFYGENAISFVSKSVRRRYPDIIEYCCNRLKEENENIWGGNLSIFNIFVNQLVSARGIDFVYGLFSNSKLFIEDGGYTLVAGDGSFLLDLELEKLRSALGVYYLQDIFSGGCIFGGMQEDKPKKNDYLTINQVLNKYFNIIERVRCDHKPGRVNDLVLLNYAKKRLN